MDDLLRLPIGVMIDVDNGVVGEVVFNSISGEYSTDFPRAIWEKHGPGIMIKQVNGTLIFHDQDYLETSGRIELLEGD